MKVLVADDDPTLRMLMRELLESSLHCQVVEASNGQEAWQVLDSGTAVDICIFDLKMPRMGGMELVAKLRQDDRFKQQKIMVCSGVNERAPILEAVSLGVDGYLLKPFVGDSLQVRVRKLMEKPVTPAAEALTPMNQVLQQLGTNREAYLRLLKVFTDDVSAIITTLLGEWTAEVRNDCAIRLASMQGTAQKLGAVQLAVRIGSLEQSVKKNETAAKISKTSALEVENKRVISATNKIAGTGETGSEPPWKPADAEANAPKSFGTTGIIGETDLVKKDLESEKVG